MICRNCRTNILSRLHQRHTVVWSASSCARQLPWQTAQLRNYSDGKPSVSAAPPAPKPRQPVVGDISIPSAISSATPGVSQPLSTPEEAVPAPATASAPAEQPEKPTKPAVERPPSSCPAGTKLNGLNYFKNKPDVFAKEDSEYPDWLWDLLEDPKKQGKRESGGVDLSSMNKKQRKRYEKKMAAHGATLPVKIPVHHQATDITPAPYSRNEQAPADILAEVAESVEKRAEVTKSARAARRKEIKESNFLRGL